MDVGTLLDNFDIFANAPGGVNRLRQLIVKMAIEGNLLPVSAWHKGCLDDLVTDSVADGDWIESKDQDPNGDVRLIQLADIGAFTFRDRSNRFVNRQTFLKLKCKLLKSGDVLIARLPDPIGRACIFPGLDQDCITVVDVAIVRPDLERLLPKYLLLLLNSVEMHTRITNEAAGTTRLRIATGKIRKMSFDFPESTAEQQLIIAKVDELMALCDQLEQQQIQRDKLRTATRRSAIDAISTATKPEELEAAWKRIENNWEVIADTPESVDSLRALIFDLAIRGTLVTLDANDGTASDLLKQIKDKRDTSSKQSEHQSPVVKFDIGLPEIPSHWAWTSIQEIGKVNPRNEAKDDMAAGFVPMASVSANYSTKHQYEQRQWGSIKKGYTHLSDGDVAVAKITPCFENGKSCVVSDLPNGIGAGTTELLVVRPVMVSPEYILIFLKSSLFYNNGIPRMTGTAGQKRLPTEFFKSCPLPLPPLPEQKRIVAKVDELLSLCGQLESGLKARSELAEKFARSVVSAA
jgi:type I restriction enzyme, S subunit